MKKRVFAAATAAMMTVSALGSVTAGAFEQTSYAEDVSVYVNGQKIDNGQYKPIIANDRTLVRLVPIFEALGYSNSYDSNAKTVTFAKDGGTVSYKFTAENYTAETISDGQAEATYELDVPATLQYSDVFYVPLRAFCDMVGLNITWDNATRSVYVESALLTYEQAKEKAAEFVNDSDILLGGDTATVEHNGRQAYAFVLRSKELVENGGSPVVLLVVFCVVAPLALFRGPLMIWGSGIALASILQAMGVFTEPYLFMLFLVPPVAIVASSCPTQSWTMWALSYAKLEPKTYIKTNLPWGWLAMVLIDFMVDARGRRETGSLETG